MLIYWWHNTSPFLTDIKQTITNGNRSYLLVVVSLNNIQSFINIYVTFWNHRLKWLDDMCTFPLKYAYVMENEHMCYLNVHKTIAIMWHVNIEVYRSYLTGMYKHVYMYYSWHSNRCVIFLLPVPEFRSNNNNNNNNQPLTYCQINKKISDIN